MDIVATLKSFITDDELTVCSPAKKALQYSSEFKNNQISQDEYNGLLGQLKVVEEVSKDADDLKIIVIFNNILDEMISLGASLI